MQRRAQSDSIAAKQSNYEEACRCQKEPEECPPCEKGSGINWRAHGTQKCRGPERQAEGDEELVEEQHENLMITTDAGGVPLLQDAEHRHV